MYGCMDFLVCCLVFSLVLYGESRVYDLYCSQRPVGDQIAYVRAMPGGNSHIPTQDPRSEL